MNKKLGRALNGDFWVVFILLFLFTVVTAIMGHYLISLAELIITGVSFAIYIIYRTYRKRELYTFVQKYTDAYAGTTGAKAPFPTALIRLFDGGIVYADDAFVKITGLQDRLKTRLISEALPAFNSDWLTAGKHEAPYDVTLQGRRYRIHGSMIRGDDPNTTYLGLIYLADLTELYQVRDEYIRSRPVVSIILVDNYDELTRNMTEAAISAMNAKINDAILKWAEDYHGLLRRLEKNRFLLITEKRDLKQAVENKFSLLEQIHEITSPAGVAASISFGLGVDAATFEEGYEFAALAIEMALSRGGDQAVVKDRLNFHFYGGRTKETEHRSKVRSRVTANSLMELIGQSSEVFVMGHKNADLDAVGAAVGIVCLCRKKGKSAYIVIDQDNNVSQELIGQIRQVPEYKGVFISAQEALLRCDNRSTLVVVDTNRPDQVESKALLETISRVCVVDHHRRAADYITPVVVNLHEPYASSASELVTEILQYAVERDDVLPEEAKALMAGIFLDTKSFNVRTGERTFEAAAYLRQLGADTVEAKKLLQNDFHDTMEKYQIIKSARLYGQEIAISALNNATSRTLAAAAADELLNISGISASFVLYPDGDRVIISARSIGKANVQVILEPLGGGGNSATAGAQIPDSTVKEVLDRLLESINQYFES
ncbi:MAG: DHH family phosphoesterase [Oscillospiraceae bacterium]|nr:DHH family phosphoesterase [Oscillospiraceae bacterium]